VAEVAARLGTTTHSLYAWLKRYGEGLGQPELSAHQVENRRLKAELERVTEARDSLNKAAAYEAQGVWVKYAFMRDHEPDLSHPLEVPGTGCAPERILRLVSGAAVVARAREERRLTGLVKAYWLASGGVYGYRKVHADLRAPGETGGKHRVARLMRQAGLKAQIGYGRRPRTRAGPPAVVAVNRLQQRFDVRAPNQTWVTDITTIRTHEGWL
jgi:hypothetical protein